MELAFGIILLVMAVFLIVAVLMQSGKDKKLSGTIAGGAETFFGKTKGSTLDKKLSKLTTIVAIVFVVLVLVSYLIQSTDNQIANYTPSTSDLENLISEAIERVSAGKTTISIAHRLSTLKNCDYLMAIDNGELAEMGSAEELLEKKGIYYKLWTLQNEQLHKVMEGR